MPIASCNGINIYYEVHGSGEPLVLISGLGGDHFFWQQSLEPLGVQFQVITYDTRGICQSDMPEGPYSMDLFADDLLALLDRLEIRQAHILGFSMGGNIALTFALKYPDRVSKLIVAASHATPTPQIRHYVDAVLDLYERGISTKQMFSLVAPWLFSNRFLGDPANEAALQYDEADPFPQPLYAWKAQYLAQREYDVRDRIASIDLPVLILCADQDPFAPLASATFMHQQIRGSQLHVIADSGHLMNFEHPEAFHQLILEFLTRS